MRLNRASAAIPWAGGPQTFGCLRQSATLAILPAMRFPIALVVLALAAGACVPIARDAACVTAEECDLALERPFGDFAVTDPVFGDDLNGDGTIGDAGTCWQNAEAAAPCVAACNEFLADQVEIAVAQNNQAVIDACGGVEE